MGEKTNSNPKPSVFDKFDELNEKISQAKEEEQKWSVNVEHVQSGTMSDIEMRAVFDEFDEDKGGSIDAKELQRAMDSLGQTLTMQEVNDLILEIDANGDGEVDFDEFKVMATKGWFKKAFESELVDSLQKSMAKYEDEDDDKNIDDEESDNAMEETNDSPNMPSDIDNNVQNKQQIETIARLQNEIKELMSKHLEQTSAYKMTIEENEKKLEETQMIGAVSLNNLKTKIKEIQKEKEQINEEKQEYAQKIEEFEEKLVQTDGERDKAVNALKDIMNGLHLENDKLKTDLQQCKDENAELKQQLNEFNDSLHGVQDKNISNDDKMDVLVHSNAELQSGMDSMKEEMSVLKEKMNKIQID